MLMRKKLILVKPEATYGADSTPDGSNRIYVNTAEPSYYEGDRQELSRLKATLGANAEVNTGPYASLNITVGLAGSGEAGVPPVFGPLLRACGLSEAIDTSTPGSESVTYAPVSEDFESCTIYYLEDGVQQKLTGCRGTVTLNAQRGQFPTLQFTMTGMYHKPTAASPVTTSAITQADEIPVNKQNTTTFSIHGHAGCGESLSVDMGNEIVHRNLIGCEKVYLTNRSVSGQFNIEAPNIGTKDYFAAVESHQGHTTGPVEFVHGLTAGNIVAINAPAVQLSTIGSQDSDGIIHYQMDSRWLPKDGDDEISIVFT